MRRPFVLTCAFLGAGGALHAAASRLHKPEDVAKSVEASFKPFPKVKTRHDEKYFYVESDGMPDHPMMVGITAWQQQLPLPQKYFGDNAWRFPLVPVVANEPQSAKTHFFRGAIAIAANGIPIFNPIKNDGRTDTLVAGELDDFGGHSGRADDYHYHIAPLHLQKTLGDKLPVAYALDGYPIYGLNEPDGSRPKALDEFNGHTGADGRYHYHATKTYPYLNGGFHGEVVEADGQVDPQPRAEPIRPDGDPLPGAKIVSYEKKRDGSYIVNFTWSAKTYAIHVEPKKDGSATFHYLGPDGRESVQTYAPRPRRGQ